jgi:drug/metabolite transporter (DMT)-like permease
VRTALLTTAAIVAFAMNSLLCRMALGAGDIDAASFVALRIGAGAVVLVPWVWRSRRRGAAPLPWSAALALFGYAAAFSFAYLSLPTGVGALLLFGAVQGTMIGAHLRSGAGASRLEWAGLIAAFGGLVWLVAPGLSAPPLVGSALMLGAGFSWGCYSLLGRGVADPAGATAWSFLRATPLALALVGGALLLGQLEATPRGIILAVVSGAVTSGLGYVIWYLALRGHTSMSAAVVQLLVPVLAAGGGVIVLGEIVTGRLLGASVLILGGVIVHLRACARRG